MRPPGWRTSNSVIDSQTRRISLEVVPLKNLKERCFLVLFEPAPARGAGPARKPSRRERSRRCRLTWRRRCAKMRRLRNELAAAREYLQSVTEQYEAANEELQAANEEAQSSNEELQSINEELETTKEELQSTNEELTTVNEEMGSRNVELHQHQQRPEQCAQRRADVHRRPRRRPVHPALHAPGAKRS